MKGILLRGTKVHEDKRHREKYPQDFIDQAYQEAEKADKRSHFRWLLSERKNWRDYRKTNDDILTFRDWIKGFYEA